MLRRTSPRSAAHYDRITDAWRYIFGEHFHYGYFASPEVELPAATRALIDELAKMADIGDGTRVLDIGCGIGEPALYLHEKFGCPVTGITTSERGVGLARARSEARRYADSVRFLLADGVDTGLPAESFDICWALESSHLMDKARLFAECGRLLRSGGSLLLCDVMLRRPITISDHLTNLFQLRWGYVSGYLSMKKAYGPGRTESFDDYRNKLAAAGFGDIRLVDVSRETLPTMQSWRKNIESNRQQILLTFDEGRLRHFERASYLMEHLFEKEMLGYGLLSAVKR
jgi:27-O-demethylrifamycin SV methyltransferase